MLARVVNESNLAVHTILPEVDCSSSLPFNLASPPTIIKRTGGTLHGYSMYIVPFFETLTIQMLAHS